MTLLPTLRLEDDLDPLELDDEDELDDDEEEGDDLDADDELDDEEEWLMDEDDEPPYRGDVEEE
jgi:hypothetical protein